jgi:hypothetical protein
MLDSTDSKDAHSKFATYKDRFVIDNYNRQLVKDTVVNKPSKPKFANLHYIRAAILQHTGVSLTLKQVSKYLIEEGLLTESQAKALVFDNYDSLYYNAENNVRNEVILPVDKIIVSNTDIPDIDIKD